MLRSDIARRPPYRTGPPSPVRYHAPPRTVEPGPGGPPLRRELVRAGNAEPEHHA